MSKRKPASSHLGPIRAYLAPVLLWLSILAVAWVSVSELTGDRPSADQGASPATPDRQQHHEQRPSSSTTAQRPVSRLQISPPAKQDKSTSQTDTASSAAPQQQATSSTADANNKQSRHETAAAQTGDAADQHAETGTRTPARSTSARSTASAHVARAQLTSGVKHKEPIDRITGVFHSKHKPLRRLYYFTEITGLSGETVTHRWWHDGRLMAKVTFRIGSNSWRAYSVKKLIPRMSGSWRVVATDSQGHTLSSARFIYATP